MKIVYYLILVFIRPSVRFLEEPPPIRFRECASAAGMDFRFFNGSRGKHDLPEIMGGGIALIDADGNGKPDVYLCDGGPIGRSERFDPPCRLFLNQGRGRFLDWTAKAHAPGPSYAMGAAVGDYDGDGKDDLFVTGWRDCRLYRNLGEGRFEDVTEKAGLVSGDWSTSAAFADLDDDGDLDLYVANYLTYDPTDAPRCSAPDGGRDYCGPEDFPAESDRLYRNQGNGTFLDISKSAGIAPESGRGLGVLIADLAGDSKPDIFVSNDGTACHLYENLGNLRFQDVALRVGVAFDGEGNALAAMGSAFGDIDGDERPDLLVANFLGRSTVLFRNLGRGFFKDESAAFALAKATRSVLGFGLVLEDFNGDGTLDLFQANGHVLDRRRLGVPFAMRSTLLRNEGGKRFAPETMSGCRWIEKPILGRGVAVGDLDEDGRPDLVVNSIDSKAAVLINRSSARNRITLEYDPVRSVAVRVRATIGAKMIARQIVSGGSYLSASEPKIFLGLDRAERVDRLEAVWPDGKRSVWKNVKAGSVLKLKKSK